VQIVCLEVGINAEPVDPESPCEWSMNYQSVIGFGKAVFIKDLEKMQGIECECGRNTMDNNLF